MFRSVAAGLALGLLSLTPAHAEAEAGIDCRIRALPPASYRSQPLPEVKYRAMPLAELQVLFRKLAGLPARAPGLDYCSDPLGFVYPWGKGETPTIYHPSDVSDRCRREVIEHEEAHVRGWPLDHPRARLQDGPCKARAKWPRTLRRNG